MATTASTEMTLRDRLLLAFANLAGHGIDSRPAFGASRQLAAAEILGDLHARHPHAVGAWVPWNKPDDSAFAVDGELRRPSVLHYSTDDVVSAVLAACVHEDILAEATVTRVQRRRRGA